MNIIPYDPVWLLVFGNTGKLTINSIILNKLRENAPSWDTLYWKESIRSPQSICPVLKVAPTG